MKLGKFILLLATTLLSLTSGCNIGQSALNEMNINELFSNFIRSTDLNQDQEYIRLLEDSLLNHTEGYFTSLDFEPMDSAIDDMVLRFHYSEEFGQFKILARNVLEIDIDRKNAVYIENEPFDESMSYDSVFTKFLFNPNWSAKLPERELLYIPELDTVWYSKQGVFFETQLIPNSTGARTSLALLKKFIVRTVDVYMAVRDHHAMKHWNTPYEELELERKKALRTYWRIHILVFVNSEFQPREIPFDDEVRVEDVLWLDSDEIDESLFDFSID